MIRRRPGVCLILLGALLGAAGCSSVDSSSPEESVDQSVEWDADTTLKQPGTDGPVEFGVNAQEVADGQAYSVGSLAVCVEDGEVAKITGVTPVEPEGLEVAAFATHYPLGGFGSARIPLDQVDEIDLSRRTVESSCPDDPTGLALELHRTDPLNSGKARGFQVEYTLVDGRTEQMVLPFVVVLCSPDDESEDCREEA